MRLARNWTRASLAPGGKMPPQHPIDFISATKRCFSRSQSRLAPARLKKIPEFACEKFLK
jgi:hypothetical protein